MVCREYVDQNQYRANINIPYDNKSKRQVFDIYYPRGLENKMPLIIYIHGGGYVEGDKRTSSLRPYLEALKNGYAVASLNYRLCYEEPFPAAILDVRKAIRYIKENSEYLRIDPERIAVAGNSAGGYLSEMLCTAYDSRYFLDLEEKSDTSCKVSCGVACFSPVNFSTFYEEHKANGDALEDEKKDVYLPSLFLGQDASTAPKELLEQASTTTYINPDMVPMLLQHGSRDRVIPVQQSIGFAKKAEELAPGKVSFEIIENGDHSSDHFYTDDNIQKWLDFIYKHI